MAIDLTDFPSAARSHRKPKTFDGLTGWLHALASDDRSAQYFQSIIALELGITGALLWQIRYFEHGGGASDQATALSPMLGSASWSP